MKLAERKLDISHNVRMIEWLKTELLGYVSKLFSVMMRDGTEQRGSAIGDMIANLITICYLLGKRLGISYSTVDIKIRDNLEHYMNHEIEKKYNDLSELVIYMDSTRQKK